MQNSDVAGFHELQNLRLLPELRAGILVDQHGALAQLFSLSLKISPKMPYRLSLAGHRRSDNASLCAPALAASSPWTRRDPAHCFRLVIVSPWYFNDVSSSSDRGC